MSTMSDNQALTRSLKIKNTMWRRQPKSMKTYEEINRRIEAGEAVILTADEIIDYADQC